MNRNFQEYKGTNITNSGPHFWIWRIALESTDQVQIALEIMPVRGIIKILEGIRRKIGIPFMFPL